MLDIGVATMLLSLSQTSSQTVTLTITILLKTLSLAPHTWQFEAGEKEKQNNIYP
jgi:hypothetical protein